MWKGDEPGFLGISYIMPWKREREKKRFFSREKSGQLFFRNESRNFAEDPPSPSRKNIAIFFVFPSCFRVKHTHGDEYKNIFLSKNKLSWWLLVHLKGFLFSEFVEIFCICVFLWEQQQGSLSSSRVCVDFAVVSLLLLFWGGAHNGDAQPSVGKAKMTTAKQG